MDLNSEKQENKSQYALTYLHYKKKYLYIISLPLPTNFPCGPKKKNKKN